jgi:hypothetical protein
MHLPYIYQILTIYKTLTLNTLYYCFHLFPQVWQTNTIFFRHIMPARSPTGPSNTVNIPALIMPNYLLLCFCLAHSDNFLFVIFHKETYWFIIFCHIHFNFLYSIYQFIMPRFYDFKNIVSN